MATNRLSTGSQPPSEYASTLPSRPSPLQRSSLPTASSSSSYSLSSQITSTTFAPPPSASVPINQPVEITSSSGGSGTKRLSIIYDRSLNKTRGGEVSLAAWEFFFSEVVQYTQKRVAGIPDFERKLNNLGYRIGLRLAELLPLRDSLYPITSGTTSYLSSRPSQPTRILRLIPLLSHIHTNLYKYLFGKPADSLEKSTDNEDEYMLGDNDPKLTRGIRIPKEMNQLSCMAMVAGIVEAFMDGMGFPARVTAHNVATDAFPRRCVILIKLDRSVMEREAAFSS